MTAQVLQFPPKGTDCIEAIGKIGFTGEPAEGTIFSEELQEQLLFILDAEYDSIPMLWLVAIVKIILESENLNLSPQAALQIWADARMDMLAADESDQFA